MRSDERAAPVLVAARLLSKRYGQVQALADADLALAAGEVHAIVGENGAGKSTMAKIIAGAVAPDGGAMQVRGRDVSFAGRRDAIAAGIGYVPQALSLVGALTLVENLALGRDRQMVDSATGRRDLRLALERLGARIDVDAPTGNLAMAEQQLGEIALALAQGAEVLLLDEPTSTLGPLEVDRLIGCVRDLAKDGAAVALVTHRIVEVLRGADVVTVLRGGRLVHSGPTAPLTVNMIAQFMVGDRDRTVDSRARRPPGETRIAATGLAVRENGQTILDGVNLDVRAGEIVGVAGVAGPAQGALADTLVGIRIPSAGQVRLGGEDITGRAGRAVELGMAYVPDNRPAALIHERPISENASLLRLGEAVFRRFGLRQRNAEVRHARSVAEAFNVHPPNPHLPAGGLSGGNQQKLMMGRELEREPQVIVVHGPTQGLDLAAAATIRNRLVAAAERGAAVLVISADLDEILTVSDRVVVLSGHGIADQLDVVDGQVDMARLGRAMAGAT